MVFNQSQRAKFSVYILIINITSVESKYKTDKIIIQTFRWLAIYGLPLRLVYMSLDFWKNNCPLNKLNSRENPGWSKFNVPLLRFTMQASRKSPARYPAAGKCFKKLRTRHGQSEILTEFPQKFSCKSPDSIWSLFRNAKRFSSWRIPWAWAWYKMYSPTHGHGLKIIL